jgi:hypothetical protein
MDRYYQFDVNRWNDSHWFNKEFVIDYRDYGIDQKEKKMTDPSLHGRLCPAGPYSVIFRPKRVVDWPRSLAKPVLCLCLIYMYVHEKSSIVQALGFTVSFT